ncbi:MAG: phosphoribosylglycinamide formyltransferase, partial [Steroidobacteraceae bacterium]
MNIAVLASHEGTTLQAVLDACAAGTIAGGVTLVIGNNPVSGALRRARAAAVPALCLSGATHPDPEALDRAICAALEAHAIDIVLLAGYMKRIGRQTLARFAGRLINTHPALLPKFGGRGMFGAAVHRAVLAAGERLSGASVHLIDGEYDSGPLIAQATVGVREADTADSLAARVQQVERALVVRVLAEIASGERPL